MGKKGGGLFEDALFLGIDYKAYQKSNSFVSFLGYRILYALMFFGIIIGFFLVLRIFMKPVNKQQEEPTHAGLR
jgi:hypothetical protein